MALLGGTGRQGILYNWIVQVASQQAAKISAFVPQHAFCRKGALSKMEEHAGCIVHVLLMCMHLEEAGENIVDTAPG